MDIKQRLAEAETAHARHVTIINTCKVQMDASIQECARLKGQVQILRELTAEPNLLMVAGPAPEGMVTPRVDPDDIDPETATIEPMKKADVIPAFDNNRPTNN